MIADASRHSAASYGFTKYPIGGLPVGFLRGGTTPAATSQHPSASCWRSTTSLNECESQSLWIISPTNAGSALIPMEYSHHSTTSRVSNGHAADPKERRPDVMPLTTTCSATTPLGWEGKTGTPGQAQKNLHLTMMRKGGGIGQWAHLAEFPLAGTGQRMGATGPHTRDNHWRPPSKAQYLD
jgi:hypothetical protein